MLISIKNLVDSRLMENNTAYKARKYESETLVIHINKQDANILFTRKYNKFRVFFIDTSTASRTEISLYEAMDSIRYYLDDAWIRVDDEILTGDEIIEIIQSYINEYIEISLLGYEAL